ncbi:uncharacterized protein FMAN_11957 [Fusarium mangiferae]|uniref:Uncharacterized protein n=1 Tax=Fusarium mangiferae TaxID=192010 RepID=A0A1L7UET5_FUSMA|nr:uncharacterized protein FMAN_11957 [Fusarium mangiferae]CVL06863.1 uncharacterized protein FMAN_11957 [Fusarium mangiferae]
MDTASVEKPNLGANVDILKVARQIQHLAHFLTRGPPIPGLSVSDKDLKMARILSPVIEITSHRRRSDLEFPREWVEDDGALAIVLRDWRRDIDPTKLSNPPALTETPAQATDTPKDAENAEADIEAYANMSFLSYSAKREAHWIAKTKELEQKLRRSEQEKESLIRENLKLQRDVEVVQRKADLFHTALFDPKKSIHESNLKAKVKLHGEVRQLERSLVAATSKNESLVKKNEDLESCNKSLVTENEELVKKTENLELSNYDLVTENAELLAELKELDSDDAELLTMIQEYLNKHALSREATKTQEENLIAEKQTLESKNEALVKKLEAQKIDNKCCAAQAKKLRERYELSVVATKVVKEHLEQLTAKVNDLDSSKFFLEAHNNDLSMRNAALGHKNKQLEESLDKIVMGAKGKLQAQ